MTPVFNKADALERMAFDASLFREMIELLQDDGPRRLREVQAGLESRELKRVHHAAHSLKGLAANFSAARTTQAAAAVESLAKSGDDQGRLPAAAQELGQALDELLVALAPHALLAQPLNQGPAPTENVPRY
jgi:HPt (histidine-containing phosphotransfer) domain-containing protein